MAASFLTRSRRAISIAGFDLNGCWVPFYNWHKLFAGLLDANEHCGSKQAIDVAVKLADYRRRVRETER
jgi:DUF1680 family protein